MKSHFKKWFDENWQVEAIAEVFLTTLDVNALKLVCKSWALHAWDTKQAQIDKLRELVKIQCSRGTWNWDPYMHGMANGMILALSVLEGKEPKFLSAPNKWLSDDLESPLKPLEEYYP